MNARIPATATQPSARIVVPLVVCGLARHARGQFAAVGSVGGDRYVAGADQDVQVVRFSESAAAGQAQALGLAVSVAQSLLNGRVGDPEPAGCLFELQCLGGGHWGPGQLLAEDQAQGFQLGAGQRRRRIGHAGLVRRPRPGFLVLLGACLVERGLEQDPVLGVGERSVDADRSLS
jgi:hypothetical protein